MPGISMLLMDKYQVESVIPLYQTESLVKGPLSSLRNYSKTINTQRGFLFIYIVRLESCAFKKAS
jgi:hypothetical protein